MIKTLLHVALCMALSSAAVVPPVAAQAEVSQVGTEQV